MYRNIFGFVLIIAMMSIAMACASDSTTESIDTPQSGSETVANTEPTTPDDDHADDGHSDVADEHADDDHVVISDDEHEDEHTEAAEHPHGEAVVDPNAPVVHVYASEFGYETDSLEAHAGEPFTIMLHNAGALEHDIVIEGFENDGGIHLTPGEDGKATFTVSEHGEYKVYCTVPGHRDAGMESILTVEGEHA
jgi:uncharacterized cupredoxin-like copper-binding protein